ncbi:ATP-binding protein [Pectinatus brassicae]|uniref:ATP-binding protein n=1 Tax=Pectinatus brassicae TaxID=862415 RepID=UPI002EDB7342
MESLYLVQDFIEQQLQSYSCDEQLIMPINLAAEEIFVNIVQYGFSNTNDKNVIIINCFIENSSIFYLQFCDMGVPFNPLQKQIPLIDASIEERSIGGLGIYLAKKLMDGITYEFTNGKNKLTLKKSLVLPK